MERIDSFIDKLEYVLKKIFTCKWLYYVLISAIACFLCYKNVINNLISAEVLSSDYMLFYYIGSTIIIFATFFLLISNNVFKKLTIEKKYLLIALTLGSIYLTISPVFTQSDESFHFIRAYQVSKFHFISPYDQYKNSYDVFPKSIYETLWDDDDRFPEYKNYSDSIRESSIKLKKQKTVVKDVRAHGYIFLNYLPHAIGIKIGNILNLSPYFLGLLGRIFNMFFCTLIVFLSIKIIPVFKKTLSVLMLMPTVIAYMASLSADGVVISSSLLLISLVAKYIYDKKKVNWKNYLILLCVILFVSTCKVCYLPIIGIVLLLPYDCFDKKIHKYIFSLSLIMIGLVCSLIWLRITAISLPVVQEASLFDKLTSFMYAYTNSLAVESGDYLINIVGGHFMYQNRVTPYIILSFIYLLLFYATIQSEEESLNLRFLSKFVTVIIIILTVTLISYALYFGEANFGKPLISGIQGRYFIPSILLLPLILNSHNNKLNINKIFDIIIIINSCVLFSMLAVFVY